MANNAGQTLKAKAVTAQTAGAAADQTKYAALIARLTAILVAEADKGLEKYLLPHTDPDFEAWSSAAGLKYLRGPGRMLQVEIIRLTEGVALEINWSDPKPDPV